MSKKLRREPIFIAPQIFGYLEDDGTPLVLDERSGKELDLTNVEDKVIIYERQLCFTKPFRVMPTLIKNQKWKHS